MATSELQIVLSAIDKASSQIGKVQESISKMGASSANANLSFGKLTGAFAAGQVVYNSAVAVWQRLSGAISNSVKAAEEQQIAETKLATLLGNVKGAREGDLKLLTDQATALQSVTAASDEEIINAQAMLATDQLRGDQIKRLIPGILDMAAANAGVGETMGDVSSAATQLGKSFTQGAGTLSRFNVTMTDAEKKAFDLADKEGKINILTKTLQENFGGAAVAVGETFAGRVKIAQNNLNELQEKIGRAVIPTLDMILDRVNKTTSSMQGNEGQVNQWGKALYFIANILMGVGQTIYAVIKTIITFGATMYDAGGIVVGVLQDMWGIFKGFFTNVAAGVRAIIKAFQGDFSGAADELNKTVGISLSNTRKAFDNFSMYQSGMGKDLADTWGSVGASFQEAFVQKGYKPVAASVQKLNKEIASSTAAASDAAKKKAEELQNSLDDLTKSYVDTKNKIASSLADLSAAHKEKLDGIKKNIDEVQQKVLDLQGSYNQDVADLHKDTAGKIADVYKNLDDKRTELAKLQATNENNNNQDRIVELQQYIQKEQAFLNSNNAYLLSLQDQITKAKDFSNKSEIEQLILTAQAKEQQAQKEYNDKMQALNDEKTAFVQQQNDEISAYQEKSQQLTAMDVQVTAFYQGELDNREAVTQAYIDREKTRWADLKNAVDNVASNKAANQVSNLLTYENTQKLSTNIATPVVSAPTIKATTIAVKPTATVVKPKAVTPVATTPAPVKQTNNAINVNLNGPFYTNQSAMNNWATGLISTLQYQLKA